MTNWQWHGAQEKLRTNQVWNTCRCIHQPSFDLIRPSKRNVFCMLKLKGFSPQKGWSNMFSQSTQKTSECLNGISSCRGLAKQRRIYLIYMLYNQVPTSYRQKPPKVWQYKTFMTYACINIRCVHIYPDPDIATEPNGRLQRFFLEPRIHASPREQAANTPP